MGDLSSELRLLRRGRGVMVSNLRTRIGPTLRMRAGIGDSAGLSETRERILAYLNSLAEALPIDLRSIFCVTLALNQDTQFRFLEERREWLASRLNRDVRTVSRRFNEALDLLDSADSEVCLSKYTANSADGSRVNYQIKLPGRLASLPPTQKSGSALSLWTSAGLGDTHVRTRRWNDGFRLH
jgi:hypothetical protein